MEVLKNLLQCFVQLGVAVKNKLQQQAEASTSGVAHPFLCLSHAICPGFSFSSADWLFMSTIDMAASALFMSFLDSTV